MSLTGNAESSILRGKINTCDIITLSAYGIAVKNGFKGTEEEWLASLEANPVRIQYFVEEYLKTHPTTVDATLTKMGEAAEAKATGEAIAGAKKKAEDELNAHSNSKENPHNVTASQVGLGNVNNTSDIDKPVSTAQAEAILDEANKVRAEKAETETFKGTFSASGWSGSAPFTQTITVNGVLSTDYPFVDIDLSNVSDASAVIEGWAMVGRCTVSGDNKVTAYCYEEKPTVNLPIILKVVR